MAEQLLHGARVAAGLQHVRTNLCRSVMGVHMRRQPDAAARWASAARRLDGLKRAVTRADENAESSPG